MKKHFINFFRDNPSCTGLLFLVVLRHFVAVEKDWLPIYFLYICVMFAYMVYILPKVEQQKIEKTTWITVASTVVALSVTAVFLMA